MRQLWLLKNPHRFLITVCEVHDLGKGGQRPAAGVQCVQRGNGVKVREDGVYPDHPEHAGTHYHNNGGHHSLAKSAGSGDGAIHKGGDAVGKAHHAHALHAGINDGALGGEQGKEGAAKEEQASAQDQAHTKGVGQTDEITLLYAVRLASAVVLAHKACTGHIECGHAVVDHGIGIGGGAVALDHERVEGVDPCLNEQVCNGENGILETGRKTKAQNALCCGGVQMQLLVSST